MPDLPARPEPAEVREFDYVPTTVADCWRGTYGGCTDEERTEALEDFCAAVDWCFNPRDGDGSQESLLIDAMLAAARFIASLPCTCPPGDDDGPCGRCAALGRWHDERCER